MAADGNLELALKIKADLDAARKHLDGLAKSLDNVGKEGKSAGGTLGQTGKAVDQVGQSGKGAAPKLDDVSQALDHLDRKAKTVSPALKNASKDIERVGLTAGQQKQAMRQLPAQITDIVTGLTTGQTVFQVAIQQGGQLRDSFGGVGGALKGVASLITPARLAIGGIAGVVALLAVGLTKGYLEFQRLESALIATGDYAGKTATQLQDLARAVGDNGGYAEARKAVQLLAESGKVTGAALDDAARGAVAFAQLTGRSIDDAVDAVVSLQGQPVQAVRKLDEQYHFLGASTYAQIRALQEQGRTTDAAALAQKSFADAMADRRNRDVENLGSIQRAWHGLGTEVGKVVEILKNYGSASISAQIAALEDRKSSKFLDDVLGAIPFAGRRIIEERNADIDRQIAKLREQAKAEEDATAATSKHRQEQEKGNQALDYIASQEAHYAAAAKSYVDHLDEINRRFDAAIKVMPGKADALNARRGALLRKVVDEYAKSLRAGHHGSDGVASAAAAADVAAVQNALAVIANAYQNADKQLAALRQADRISDQAYYDGLRADLAKYEADKTAALEREKTAATAHVKTQADRIRADQAVAKIDAEITQLHQDSATKRIEIDAQEKHALEASAQAWEHLRDSLRTPVEMSVDRAIDQLTQLNTLMQKLKGTAHEITPEQYADAIKRIADKSVHPAPQYQGLDAAVGGIGSELAKNVQAQAKLDQWHQQALAANEAFRAKDTANEQAYQEGLARIDAQYAAQRNQIEQARGQLMLQTASGLFGQLATLSTSHNTKIARIGKAAAIANALITTYQNAVLAYKDGLQVGGPYGIAVGAAFAAVAVAAGLAQVAQIRAQPVGGGYADGGYTGDGAKHQIAGYVHAGEVVWSQADVARAGGVRTVEIMRLRGYADGGFVHPLANAPRPDELGFASPNLPRPQLPAPSGSATAPAPAVHVKTVIVTDNDQLAEAVLNTPTGTKLVIEHVGNNPRAIRGKWGS